jgi:hypothetical protein
MHNPTIKQPANVEPTGRGDPEREYGTGAPIILGRCPSLSAHES